MWDYMYRASLNPKWANNSPRMVSTIYKTTDSSTTITLYQWVLYNPHQDVKLWNLIYNYNPNSVHFIKSTAVLRKVALAWLASY